MTHGRFSLVWLCLAIPGMLHDFTFRPQSLSFLFLELPVRDRFRRLLGRSACTGRGMAFPLMNCPKDELKSLLADHGA